MNVKKALTPAHLSKNARTRKMDSFVIASGVMRKVCLAARMLTNVLLVELIAQRTRCARMLKAAISVRAKKATVMTYSLTNVKVNVTSLTTLLCLYSYTHVNEFKYFFSKSQFFWVLYDK